MIAIRLPNGYGSVYKLSGNRRRPWIARVTTGWSAEGKQLYYTVGYYPTRAAALDALAEYHKNPIGEMRDTTFGEIYERWYNNKVDAIAKSQMDAYRAAWKRMSILADEPIRHVKTSHLQEVVDGMRREGLSRSMLEKAKTMAGQIFEIALNDEIVRHNYARAIKLPPARKTKKDTFSDLEIRQLEKLAAAGDIWAGTVMILLYTGMRVGEMVALTPFQVDPNIWVITGGIKTDAGTDRPMPIHSRILPYVQYWYETGGPRLIHRDGQPMSVDYYRKHIYYPALQRAGITRHLTPHAARRTFATRLNAAKVQPKYIQALMGHADFAVTANEYIMPPIDELREAIEAL